MNPYIIVAVLPLYIFEYLKFNAKNPDISPTKIDIPRNPDLYFAHLYMHVSW